MPPRWRTPSFGRELGSVRAQLRPIRSRRALAASFSRDAAIAATTPPEPIDTTAVTSSARSLGLDAPGPVRVAYAIRWLELGDGRERAPWEAWLQGAEAGFAAAIAVVDDETVEAEPQRIGDSTR